MRLRNLITSVSNAIVTWATGWSHVFQTVTVTGTLTAGSVITSGAVGTLQTAAITGAGITVTPNVGDAVVLITATNNAAFTVALPAGTGAIGQRIVIVVVNSVGGAMGAITFNASYNFSTWTSPANGTRRAIEFQYDGTAWNQISPAGVDIS
jgi:hypothetical protein